MKQPAIPIEFLRGLLEDPEYRAMLRVRLISGDVPAGIEGMIWHYVYGKPPETLNLLVSDPYDAMSDEELAASALQLAAELQALQPN